MTAPVPPARVVMGRHPKPFTYADMAITPRVVPTRSDAGAEAVHRATIKFVAAKTADQLDLRALNQVRERVFNSSPCRQGPTGHQQIFPRQSYLRCESVA